MTTGPSHGLVARLELLGGELLKVAKLGFRLELGDLHGASLRLDATVHLLYVSVYRLSNRTRLVGVRDRSHGCALTRRQIFFMPL